MTYYLICNLNHARGLSRYLISLVIYALVHKAGAMNQRLLRPGQVEDILHVSVTTQVKPPLVSFIIPSRLSRLELLNRTLESLQNQTVSNWEAIIGVDVEMTQSEETIHLADQVRGRDDIRIKYHNIHTGTLDRGRHHNGSGGVRNQIIMQYARADWVAFIDDDDTLSPYYVEMLMRSIHREPRLDICIFRMQGYPGPTDLLPPPRTYDLHVGQVGISFAVRKSLFVDQGILFVPHQSEDYFYLRDAFDHNAKIRSSTCNMYFIRQYPPSVEEKPICRLEDKPIRLVNDKATFDYWEEQAYLKSLKEKESN